MREFTPEEISLCKQLAERHRKFIEYGGWFLNAWGKVSCACGYAYPVNRPVRREHENPKWIPLWTISNCLEFLRKRCKDHVLLIHEEDLDDDEEWYLWFDEYKETQQMGKGKTALEACLKVVLAVLKEEE